MNFGMISNYAKVSFRSLVRSKLYSLISVFGLAVGITCCLLIFLYVRHELSFDRFHANADHIYRVIQIESDSHELSEGTSSTSYPLREVLKTDFPTIESASLVSTGPQVVGRGDHSFTQSVAHVDPDFLRMFSFPLIHGDITTALENPASMIVTPDMARKFFGDEDPMGKSLTLLLGETELNMIVSGVIQAAPTNSSFQFDCLVPSSLLKYTVPEEMLQSWGIIMYSTFVEVAPGTDINDLEKLMAGHLSGLIADEDTGTRLSYFLQPLTDIHLNPQFEGEAVSSSDPLYCYILSALALAILAIACINFVTLSLGRSSTRTREVGLRKVLGAQRTQLMRQFWGEPLLLCLAATVLAVALTEAFLPTFNDLAQKKLTMDLLSDWTLLPALAVFTLLTALLAGAYPTLLLSGLPPTDAMRGGVTLVSRNRMVRALIVFQFSLSVFLILGTLVLSSQIDYVRSTPLGFDKGMVVTFPTNSRGEEAVGQLERFRNALADRPEIVDISGYSFPFGQSWLYIRLPENDGATFLIGEDVTGPAYSSADDTAVYFYMNWVDAHYMSTMGIEVVAGRSFSEEYPSDPEGAIIINETAARRFGLDNPVGQKLPKGFSKADIIGVVRDFHYYPLHRTIVPLVLHMPRHDDISSLFEIAVRIRSDNIPGTVSLLENAWKQSSGGKPFDYRFLDATVDGQYVGEQRWRRIARTAAVLSIIITCLGLFGLASLAAARRTREVGIRKVLGASEGNIVGLVSREFVILALIGIAFATPLGYLTMNRWLSGFAYHTDIGWGAVALSGGLSLAIVVASVGIQALKAARANPVEALRYE